MLSKLAARLISELDTNSTLPIKDLAKNINHLDAIYLLYLLEESWAAVKQRTIANCYRHSGFVVADMDVNQYLLSVT